MAHADPQHDRVTVASIGVLAGTVAPVAHEIVEHGSGCLAVGGHITLLTSIYFKCSGATGLTDVAGPIGSLALGLMAGAALNVFAPSSWARLFFVLLAVIGLGWFDGQMIYSAALNKDDWAFFTWSLHWPQIWRVLMVAAGAGAYVWSARLLAPFNKTGGLGLSLAAASASAALAGSLWAKAPLQSAVEGVAAVGLAPFILLWLMKRRRTKPEPAAADFRSWPWVAVAAASYALYLIGPSRGVGPLS